MNRFSEQLPARELASGGDRVLATDLDGTLIPLSGNKQNQRDLAALAGEVDRREITLVYITGRHFASAELAIRQFGLPQPDWLVCDVGTSIFRREGSRGFHTVDDYQVHLGDIIGSMPLDVLRRRLRAIDQLRLQEPEKQGPFKLSFYVDPDCLAEVAEQIQQKLDHARAPYSVIHSVDPFNGDGLVDLLPAGVSKAHALGWWVETAGLSDNSVIFAGDSGNDLAALTAGYHAIVVGNAAPSVAEAAQQAHQQAGWIGRLYFAEKPATSGVLEGCRWFGLIE